LFRHTVNLQEITLETVIMRSTKLQGATHNDRATRGAWLNAAARLAQQWQTGLRQQMLKSVFTDK
jgi:hypothetical protein